jgi:epoxyqueuosine reductase QueG
MDNITREVKEFARQVGADLVGIAGQECFKRLPSVKPDTLLSGAQSVVVVAVRRNIHIQLPAGATVNSQEYVPTKATLDSRENYVGSLTLLMQIILRISSFLEDKGFETRPVSFHGHFKPQRDVIMCEAVKELSVTTEGELQGMERFEKVFWQQLAVLSHKHLAVEAGLGEVGICQMLVTPRFGPRVYLASIVTDAPLKPDNRLEEPVCTKCGICVENCPSGAISLEDYNLVKCMEQMGSLPSIDLIRQGKKEEIERYLQASRYSVFGFETGMIGFIRSGHLGKEGCGRCFWVCPVGEKPKKLM